jgi:hypothetical protein
LKLKKQTCFNKKIQLNLTLKKNYHHSIFVQYKKITSIYFLFIYEKKFNKIKYKKIKEEKNKIENLSKEKKN